jgi:hypothetical protein
MKLSSLKKSTGSENRLVYVKSNSNIKFIVEFKLEEGKIEGYS